MSVLSEILRGGAERVQEAGAVIVGGHSMRDTGIQYGLSVTGVVDPAKMMTNRAAEPGDVLVLTKAIGTGFITTALRAKKCPQDVLDAACASMILLNRSAADAALSVGAKAATDVTGFGLAGHAGEMAQASGVTVVLELSRLPRLAGAEDAARRGFCTRANATNRRYVTPMTGFDVPQDAGFIEFLFDPQTSGGLLIAAKPDRAAELLARCRDNGAEAAAIVGRVQELETHHLIFRA